MTAELVNRIRRSRVSPPQNVRLALPLALLCLAGCSSNEAALASAAADVDAQLKARAPRLREREDLQRFKQQLKRWYERALDVAHAPPPLPKPPVSLDPPAFAPFIPPKLPPQGALESARATELRAQIQQLTEEVRSADLELSSVEALRAEVKLRYEDFVRREAENLRYREVPPAFEGLQKFVAPDAGTMRRVAP